jgi:hypothetical protein
MAVIILDKNYQICKVRKGTKGATYNRFDKKKITKGGMK